MKKFIAGLVVSVMLYCSSSVARAASEPITPKLGIGAVLVIGYLIFHKKSDKPADKKAANKKAEKKAEPKKAKSK